MKLIPLALSVILTVLIFSYLFSHIDYHQVVDIFININPGLLMLFVALSLSTSTLRAWRYWVMLLPLGYRAHPAPLFLSVLVRNLAADLLPARIGTLIDVYLLSTRVGLPVSVASSCFALGFVFDIVALAPLVLVCTLAVARDVAVPIGVILLGATALGIISVAVLLTLERIFDVISKLLEYPRLRHLSFSSTLATWLTSVTKEIRIVKATGYYSRILALSFFIRIAKYLSLYVLLLALVMPQGYGVSQFPLFKVFFGICASELVASLPISGIAGFGAYEGTWALVFELLGYSKELSSITAVSHHLFTQVYGYSLGGVALILIMLYPFRPLSGGSNRAE